MMGQVSERGTMTGRAGIPLFAAVEGQQSLKLVEAKTYPDGIVMLNYEPHER